MADDTSMKQESTTVRDRMWIFAGWEGKNNDLLEKAGFRGGSRMTPAEGAFYFNVPNIIMVRGKSRPARPVLQRGWRTKTEYEQYAISFRPLKQVVWSVVGSAGVIEGDEVADVLELAENYPNITGVFFDDFFLRPTGKGAHSPEELSQVRDRLEVSGRRLKSWLTLYNHTLNPSHPNHFKLDPPLEAYLEYFDVISFWYARAEDVEDMEPDFERLEKLCPHHEKVLGLYLHKYHALKVMPMDLMQKQCKVALQWLKEGRITNIIFLSNTVMDLGLDVVEWTREWIQEVGDERLG